MKWRKSNNGKRVAGGCRNHGTCGVCLDNRMHSTRVREQAADVPLDLAYAPDFYGSGWDWDDDWPWDYPDVHEPMRATFADKLRSAGRDSAGR